MKKTLICTLLILLFSSYVALASPSDAIDVSSIKKLPVQYSGRIQPLQSLAIDLAETVYGAKSVLGHSALGFLFELMSRPDIWYDRAIIKIGYLPLKQRAGLETEQHYFSMATLEDSQGIKNLFAELRGKNDRDEDLLPIDRKVQEVRNALAMLHAVLTGDILQIAPPENEEQAEAWLSLPELAEQPSERNLAVLVTVRRLMDAYANKDQKGFDEGVKQLTDSFKALHPAIWSAEWKWDLELLYYSLAPFGLSWVFYLISGVFLILGWRTKKRSWAGVGIVTFCIAFLFHTAGLTLRILVLSRPPVSNMYESVVFMSWMVSVIALIMVIFMKHMLLINASAFVGAAILILGSLMPFDPGLDVLVPVLRSNYWLTIHVLTIVSSYGAFALAMGIGHVTLGHFIWTPNAHGKIKELAQMIYRSTQVGVILLAAGTILGGVWANESWGRFWGWDPKETWALISLLGYLALLHARFIGWVREFGLAVGSLLCFMLVVMTWYGVNFVLGRGLHSYGFGAGGGQWVTGYVIFELLYVAFALLRLRKSLSHV